MSQPKAAEEKATIALRIPVPLYSDLINEAASEAVSLSEIVTRRLRATPDDPEYVADLEGRIVDLEDRNTTLHAFCALAREQLGEDAWDAIEAGIYAVSIEDVRAARRESAS